MTYGTTPYGGSGFGSGVAQVPPTPSPSCNLIVMELLEKYPGYLDLDNISRYIDNF